VPTPACVPPSLPRHLHLLCVEPGLSCLFPRLCSNLLGDGCAALWPLKAPVRKRPSKQQRSTASSIRHVHVGRLSPYTRVYSPCHCTTSMSSQTLCWPLTQLPRSQISPFLFSPLHTLPPTHLPQNELTGAAQQRLHAGGGGCAVLGAVAPTVWAGGHRQRQVRGRRQPPSGPRGTSAAPAVRRAGTLVGESLVRWWVDECVRWSARIADNNLLL
jgi:hypothetical protein